MTHPVSCPVIRDLLPLCAEHLAAPESQALVEEHLQHCPECRAHWEKLRTPMPPPCGDVLPLRRVRQRMRRRAALKTLVIVLAVLIGIPLFFLSLAQIGGDGIGFTSVAMELQARKALDLLIAGDYTALAEQVTFDGRPGTPEEKAAFVTGLSTFLDGDREIIGYENLRCRIDDRYTLGYVDLLLRDGAREYRFTFTLSGQYGFCFHGCYPPGDPQAQALCDALADALATSSPG